MHDCDQGDFDAIKLLVSNAYTCTLLVNNTVVSLDTLGLVKHTHYIKMVCINMSPQ